MAWKGDSRRHGLARKGVRTARVVKPHRDYVVPLREFKRKKSVWAKKFGYGKRYEVVDTDLLDGETVLVLKTGKDEDDYKIVYPDEVLVEAVEGYFTLDEAKKFKKQIEKEGYQARIKKVDEAFGKSLYAVITREGAI